MLVYRSPRFIVSTPFKSSFYSASLMGLKIDPPDPLARERQSLLWNPGLLDFEARVLIPPFLVSSQITPSPDPENIRPLTLSLGILFSV